MTPPDMPDLQAIRRRWETAVGDVPTSAIERQEAREDLILHDLPGLLAYIEQLHEGLGAVQGGER